MAGAWINLFSIPSEDLGQCTSITSKRLVLRLQDNVKRAQVQLSRLNTEGDNDASVPHPSTEMEHRRMVST